MNSDKYKAILETHLLPTMKSYFPDGDSIFQQDHAPYHTKGISAISGLVQKGCCCGHLKLYLVLMVYSPPLHNGLHSQEACMYFIS